MVIYDANRPASAAAFLNEGMSIPIGYSVERGDEMLSRIILLEPLMVLCVRSSLRRWRGGLAFHSNTEVRVAAGRVTPNVEARTLLGDADSEARSALRRDFINTEVEVTYQDGY